MGQRGAAAEEEGREPEGDGMTQNALLLEALRNGVTLTPLNALQIAGTLRLSERVRELVKDGIPIEKKRLAENGKNVMSYRLGGFAHG